MVRDQDSQPLLLELHDDLLQIVHGDRIDAGEWLIQHHVAGLAAQCPRDLRAPPLTPGKVVSGRVRDVSQSELREQLLAAAPCVLPVETTQLQHGQYVLLDAHASEDRGLLR